MSQISQYIDPTSGLVASQDGGRDNLVLFTVTALMLSSPQSMISQQELLELTNSLTTFLSLTEVKMGLYERLPGAKDNSVDNLIATAEISKEIALEIWDYGSKNSWCFNPAYPDDFSLKYWYGRFIGFVPHVKACAEIRLTLIDKVLWSIACIFSALSPYGNTSDKCLQFIMNHSMQGRSKLCDWAIDQWKWIMKHKYPMGMREVYSIYFGRDHLFAVDGPKEF